MINKARYTKLKIKPERVQALIKQIDEQQINMDEVILTMRGSK